MLFVCYPKCSTCKKAQAWLDAHSLSYQVRDIKTQNPTQEELRLWHQKSGLPLKRFFQHQRPTVPGAGAEGQAAHPDGGGTVFPAGHGRYAGETSPAGDRGPGPGGL